MEENIAKSARQDDLFSRTVRNSLLAWILSLASVAIAFGLAFGVGALEKWSGPTKAIVWVCAIVPLVCLSIVLPLRMARVRKD